MLDDVKKKMKRSLVLLQFCLVLYCSRHVRPHRVGAAPNWQQSPRSVAAINLAAMSFYLIVCCDGCHACRAGVGASRSATSLLLLMGSQRGITGKMDMGCLHTLDTYMFTLLPQCD